MQAYLVNWLQYSIWVNFIAWSFATKPNATARAIYCNVRMDDKQCLLVIIGATEDGYKELVAIEGGFRESELSWTQLLRDLKARGLNQGPQLAIGDGGLGFWKALSQVYADTRWQRCWVHKTAYVSVNRLEACRQRRKASCTRFGRPRKRMRPKRHFDEFCFDLRGQISEGGIGLQKDHYALLTFYDFPAEHWRNIRTTKSD